MLSPLLSDYESTKWSEIEHPKLTPVTLIRFVERFPVAFEPQTTAVVHERLFKLYPYCTSSSRMSKKRGIFFWGYRTSNVNSDSSWQVPRSDEVNEVNATFRRKNCGWIRSTVYTRFEMIRTYGHMRNHIILHGADFDMLDNQLFGSFCFFHLSPSPVRFIFEVRDLLCCLRQVSRNKEPVKHSYDFAWHGIFKHTELQELA